jgi:hypothetical protein
MKPRILVIALVLSIAAVPLTASTGHTVTSLRVKDPLEAAVAGLQAFIPTCIEEESVPA